ncbi:MAG: hypothetical protein K8U03_05590 [Planctomycetia bacterium]|nr:hypothetical protein [Planctomycetia bacterium]
MHSRLSRVTSGVLAFAAVALTAAPSWAVYYALGPSKDEWGLKYEVEVSAADRDMLNVAFTLADEGRLKPVHSFTVVAFSKPTREGSRTYDVKAPLELKTTADGKRAAQVRIPKKFIDQAMIRVLTLSVDGRRQTAGAAYYDIPLAKFLNAAPAVATPPTQKIIK